MYTYGLGDVQRHEAAQHEFLRDAQLAETNGFHDLADDLRDAAAECAWYLDQFRGAGICEEFPAGEFAVVGVNVAAHYDSYEDEAGW